MRCEDEKKGGEGVGIGIEDGRMKREDKVLSESESWIVFLNLLSKL